MIALLLLAAEILDHNMTAQEKWVDINPSFKQVAANVSKSRPTVSEVLQSGHYLRLSDGSLWNIRSQDTPLSHSWITAVEIIITPSGDPEYPFKLTNSLTGSSVLAKKVEKIPPTK